MPERHADGRRQQEARRDAEEAQLDVEPQVLVAKQRARGLPHGLGRRHEDGIDELAVAEPRPERRRARDEARAAASAR